MLRADPDAWKDLVPTFVSLLHEKDPNVRSRAAAMLGSLGRRAKDAIPVLEAIYEHALPAEKIAMARTILAIDPGKQAQILRAVKLLVSDRALDTATRTEAARLVRMHELGGRPITNSRAAAKAAAD